MKHGIEQHLVRPDRVYATGVLTPIVGYQPGEDAQQVAARFVAGGQGLAGLRRARFFRGTRGMGLAGPMSTIAMWLRQKLAALQVAVQSAKLRMDVKRLSLPAPVQHVLDTSPRPTMPYPGAIPTQSGWGPTPQSPAMAAAALQNGAAMSEQPPTLPALAAGLQLAPQGAGAPAGMWSSMAPTISPQTVAVRGEDAALATFYAANLPWITTR